MSGRITLTDVAQHAGVSPATASLVLRGTGRLSDTTRQRVQASMEALGYVYHRGAASLRGTRSQTIGLIVSDISNVFTAELSIGLESTLAERGVVTLMASSLEDPDRQRLLLRSMLERQVDGILIIPVIDTDQRFVDQLTGIGVPAIIASREPDDHDLSYVGIDNLKGGRLAAEHLITHDITEFGYLGGHNEIGPRQGRYAAAVSVMAKHGVPITMDVTGQPTGDLGLSVARRALRDGGLPSGLICQNDQVAFGVYRALREAGSDTGPEAIKVVSFDDVAEAALWEPPLTSIAASGRQVGIRCAEVLHRRIQDPDSPIERSLIMPSIVVRQSCGCPPPQQTDGRSTTSTAAPRRATEAPSRTLA